MNPYLRGLLRFWWIVVLGAMAGAAVGTLMLYQVDVKWPPTEVPTFKSKSNETFEASLALLVTSPVDPFIQTQTREVIEQTSRIQATRSPRPPATSKDDKDAKNPPPAPVQPEIETRLVPDKSSLVRAANLYPLLIESDFITAIREKITGPMPGIVKAKAIYSRQGNKFRPSSIPVIEIAAISPRPRYAKELAAGTAEAFKRWLAASQKRAKVPRERRIILKQLTAADRVTAIGGPSYGLPLLASASVLFGFGGIALLLDRAVPRRRRELEAVEELEETPAAAEEVEPAHLELIESQPEALGEAVAQIAREVGALRAQAKRQPK